MCIKRKILTAIIIAVILVGVSNVNQVTVNAEETDIIQEELNTEANNLEEYQAFVVFIMSSILGGIVSIALYNNLN